MPRKKTITERAAWLECAEWVTHPDSVTGGKREFLCLYLKDMLRQTPFLFEEEEMPAYWPHAAMLDRLKSHMEDASVYGDTLDLNHEDSDIDDSVVDRHNAANHCRVMFCLLMAEECR